MTTTMALDAMYRADDNARSRAVLACSVLMALFLLLFAFPSFAVADEAYEPPPAPPGSNAVASCLDADQVWLLVEDIDGEVLANQCVGTPASGEEALARGGMQIRFAKGRLICSLSGHPEQCPATFTGSYWNYLHAEAGAEYTYSQEGAADRQPSPGTIEAWCYNDPDEESCTPGLLTIMRDDQQVTVPGATSPTDYIDPAVTSNEAVPVPASTPWALVGTGSLIAVGAIALLWWRRRTGPTGSQVGGR